MSIIDDIQRKIFSKYNLAIKPTFVTINNVKLYTNDQLLSPKIRNILFQGKYEQEEISILKKVLERNDRILEVGAGLGFLSAYCSKKIDSSSVFAYEANPHLKQLIYKNYRINKVFPNLENCILENSDLKSKKFFIEKDFYSSSTFQRSDDANGTCVPVKNLNREINRIKPTFLIVDIEGGELDFFNEIKFNTIEKIILEVHPKIIGMRGTNSVIKKLLDSGYFLNTKLSVNNVLYFINKDDQ